MPLTRAQFIDIKKQAEPLIFSWLKKDCRQLALYLESQLPAIEKTDLELFSAATRLTAQLKWVACDLINDEEFYKLFRERLLEGLELENNDLARLVDNKIAMTFGIGALGLTNNAIHALRQNIQLIGNQPLMVKNETRPVRPVIRNWLVDFLRNSPAENPTDVDISNYLFNNPNCKKLSPADRNLLGRVLDFYNGLRAVTQEFAQQEREQIILAQPADKTNPPRIAPQPSYQPPPAQTRPNFAPQNLNGQAPSEPQPHITQPPSQNFTEQDSDRQAKRYTKEAMGSTYREPIEEKDLAGPPAATTTPKAGPMVQGNVIDLKNLNK